MSRSPRRRAPSALAAVAFALILSACSFSFSVGGLSQAALESEIAATLEERNGRAPESVDCAEGLDPSVGDATDCVIELTGVRAEWAVEVTGVDDDDIDFAWQIVDGSQLLIAAALVDTLAAGFEAEVGSALVAVACPDDVIPGEPGVVATCEATSADGRSGGIEIRVTEVSGMTIDFQWALL